MIVSAEVKKFFKVILPVATLLMLILGGLLLKKSKLELSPINEIKKITFSTDGKITAKWLKQTLHMKAGTNLLSLDLVPLGKHLESVGQIKKVFMEKRYPDTLFIGMEERVPILKIVVRTGEEKKLFLIDGVDGVVFSPICYEKSDIIGLLPANVSLKINGKKRLSFVPLEGMRTVKELVTILRDEFPELFRTIKFLDLGNYDSRAGAIWSTVKLHLKNGIVVILRPQNFAVQLLRLDYLLNEKCAHNLHRIKEINISSPENAIIEYK
jgi:cell division septal protein FtsQ